MFLSLLALLRPFAPMLFKFGAVHLFQMRKSLKKTRAMIRQASGMQEIDESFKEVSQATPEGAYIRLMQRPE